MRLAVLSILLLRAPSAVTQDKPKDPPDLTIKKQTRLVQIPVIVTTEDGKPVRGMTKDDFVVLEGNKERTIATFEEIRADAQPIPTSTLRLAPGVYSNTLGGKKTPKSILVLVLDAMHTAFMDQVQSRKQLISFLNTKISDQHLFCLLLMTKSGLRPIHMYTTDPKVLVAALQKVNVTAEGGGIADLGSSSTLANAAMAGLDASMVAQEASALSAFINGQFGDPDGTEGAVRTYQADMTLRAYLTLANMFKDVPGRKAVFWTSGFFPSYFFDPTSVTSTDFGGLYLRAVEALTDANVALYPVDANGLLGFKPQTVASTGQAIAPGTFSRMPSAFGGDSRTLVHAESGDTGLGSVGKDLPLQDSMKNIAELTGGLPFYGTSDLSGAMSKALKDSSDFYLMGYYLPSDTKPGRYNLNVRAKAGTGLKLRTRTKLFVAKQSADSRRELDVAKRSFLEFTNLPLIVKLDREGAKGDPLQFQINIDGKDLELGADKDLSLQIVVMARGQTGKEYQFIDQLASGKVKDEDAFRARPFVYNNVLRPISDAALLRFIVRDNNSGKIGSVIVERP